MKTTPRSSATLLAAVFLLVGMAHATPVCVDFEEFNFGNIPIGASFESQRVGIAISAALNEQGQPIPGAGAGIEEFPSGSGNRMLALSNASACFAFPCATLITLQWANAGGFVDLTVNNDTISLVGLQAGTHTVGGATLTIVPSGPGGTITIETASSGITSFCIAGSELFVDNVCHTPCPENPDCLDFEGIDKGVVVGESFFEDDLEILVIPFQGNNGFVDISTNNNANHYGQELALFNAGIAFSRGCAGGGTFEVLQAQQGIEVSINGESILVDDVKDLNGVQLGGVQIFVDFHGNRPSGTITLVGQFDEFSIAGAELYLDHFCMSPCPRDCIDFEEEMLGAVYPTGESFFEDNIELYIDKYSGGSGAGVGIITDAGRANHLGQELHLQDAALALRGTPCIAAVHFHFGQASPGVEIVINGQSAAFASMADLDGLTVGGATIEVFDEPVSFGIRGVVMITGQIADLAIGGLDLHLDHICLTFCPNPDCIDFEVFPLQATYGQGDVLMEDGFAMTVHRHMLASMVDTEVEITSANAANHFGQEARLRNARIDLSSICASTVTFRAFEHVASQATLGVNGQNGGTGALALFDGNTIGGVSVSVQPGGNGSQVVTLSGTILQFEVGGIAITIDHICISPCVSSPGADCVEFETLSLVETWNAFSFPFEFTQDGVTFTADTVYDLDDIQINDGFLAAGTAQRAGHLGRDLWMTNHSAWIDFGMPIVKNVSLHYGHYGSFINLFINGDFVVATDFVSLDGTEVGGVVVNVIRVPVPGGYTGILQFEGPINNFNLMIGGEDLYIDHLCFEEDVEPEPPFSLGKLYIISAEQISPTQQQIVLQLEVSGSGTPLLQRSVDMTNPVMWLDVPTAIWNPVPGNPGRRQTVLPAPFSTTWQFFRAVAPPI